MKRLALVVLALAACKGKEAPAPVVGTPAGSGSAAPRPVPVRDPHSDAHPDEARVTHLSLDLTVDFAKKTLAGTTPKSSETYGLFIGPDGTAQAGQCSEITKVKWPACRRLPAPPAVKKG